MESIDLLPDLKGGFYEGDEAPNTEMKCPVVLVLDKSGSMTGEPIDELNKGIKIFQTQIQNDDVASNRLECAVVAFSSNVKVIRDFSLFEGTAIETIHAGGTTNMAEGLREAMQLIETRKEWYKQQGCTYYRPYIVLITDGYPTSSESLIEEVKKEINEGVAAKKFNLWAFGVDGADMNFLETLTSNGFPAQKLKGHNFVQFFKWLSNSFAIISSSRPDELVNIAPKPGENPFCIKV